MDREKVIKGLEICTSKPCYCTDCPYKANCCLDSQEVMEDALVLLKENEAVKPQLSMSGLWYECPICHRHLLKDRDNYCARCGRRLNWE